MCRKKVRGLSLGTWEYKVCAIMTLTIYIIHYYSERLSMTCIDMIMLIDRLNNLNWLPVQFPSGTFSIHCLANEWSQRKCVFLGAAESIGPSVGPNNSRRFRPIYFLICEQIVCLNHHLLLIRLLCTLCSAAQRQNVPSLLSGPAKGNSANLIFAHY